MGYGYSRQEAMHFACEFAVQLGLRQKGTLLTDKWFYNFLGRWPELKVQKHRSLEVARATSATPEAEEELFL